MTISTDDLIDKFGTPDPVSASGGTSAVSDGAMAADADADVWINDDDAALAAAILTWQYPSGTIDGKIYLHHQQQNPQGTADGPLPTTSNKVGFLGTFDVSPGQAAATDYANVAIIRLPNAKSLAEYKFVPFNDSGVAMSAGWTLHIVPLTGGPHG